MNMNPVAVSACLALVIGVIGGCDSSPAPALPTAISSPQATAVPAQSAVPATPTAAQPTEAVGGPGDYAPGAVEFRVVNVASTDGQPQPVDVYVRTQGLVEAFAIEPGLAYGTATDYFAPPDPGTVVVLAAGADDPTCVSDCPQILSSSSTTFGEGSRRTLIVYPEGTLELWHEPDPGSVGSSGNALAPADPSTAQLYVVGVALEGADFGLRLAFAGEEGCQANLASENILVGGNQVARFAFDDAAVVELHDNGDTECADEPVGGPFEVSGDAGSRTLLVLHGQPGAMDALDLEI